VTEGIGQGTSQGINQDVGRNGERGNEHQRYSPQPHDTAYSASASLDTQRPATALHSSEYAEHSASASASTSASASASFSLYWYQNDPNGCPVRLLSSTGEVQWAASYTAWAEVDLLHTAAVDNPIRLQGQYADPETGLSYNRHRYFCPHAGQFISQDPVGLQAGENLYQYAASTFGWIDPYGLSCKGLGKYKDVGGHHIHAKAGFKGHGKYDLDEALCISQDYMKKKGWSHEAMTKKQRELFDDLADSGKKNTLAEHSRIAKEALIAGGATPREAQALVDKSLDNLASQGVTSPSHIPWN
jgi:RHS repeat-associated protein